MTRLHADQLPPDVRKRLGLTDKPGKSKPSRAGISLSEPCPGTCNCGQQFPTALAWEKHAQAAGHTRWNITLETV
jgi:hypothetical protein